jgi:hypothetical protein
VNQAGLIRLALRQTGTSETQADYALVVLNLGGRPVRLGLDAHDAGGGLSFTLPGEVTVPDGSEEEVRLTVAPPPRRLFVRTRTLAFTVTAVAENNPAVSVSVTGAYEDRPVVWKRPAIAGAGAAAAIVAVAAALLLLGGRSTSKSPSNAPKTSYTLTATLRSAPGATVMPAGLCYHLAPENVPFHVVLSQAVNGKTPATLDEWEDDGQNGGDCVIVPQMLTAGAGTLSLQAWVNGTRVGDVVLAGAGK